MRDIENYGGVSVCGFTKLNKPAVLTVGPKPYSFYVYAKISFRKVIKSHLPSFGFLIFRSLELS